MRIIIAGLGPGDCGLVSVSALKSAQDADVIIVPGAHAERIMKHYVPDTKILRIDFPMTRDRETCLLHIRLQLDMLCSEWEEVGTIFFPVIGDAMLYSTGAYMLEVMRELVPDIEAGFIPGISAHSLAASCAKRFLAQGEDIFTIIPGTAGEKRIRRALSACGSAAIYKPTAVSNLRELALGFNKIVRVDYAGYPGLERITEGIEALDNIDGYMTVILLWRTC